MKNKIVKALISAAVAIAAWLYVVTVISPNSDKHFYNIPIDDSSKVVLHDRDLMVIGMDVSEVDVLLEGNRIDLNKMTSKDIDASVDFEGANIFEPGTHKVKIDVVVSDVVDIQSRTPDKAVVEVVERATKPDVPVVVEFGDTKVHGDYAKDEENLTLDVTQIQIAGPKATVEQVAMAKVEIDLNGRKESIDESFAITLCNAKGEQVDTAYFDEYLQTVRVTMPIIRVKKVVLQPEIIPGAGATAENTTITWNPETITVSGNEEKLKELNEIIFGKIDLGTIVEDQTLTFPITLDPELVSISGITEVSVKVDLPDLQHRTLTIMNFEPLNLPEDMDVEFLTQALDVQVRGPKEKVDALKAEDLKMIVDFTDTEIGKVTRKAVLKLEDESVGVLGAYTVYVEVTKK